MPNADELKQRYEQAKLRSQKQIGCVLMLAGVVGTLASGAAFLFFLVNERTFVLPLVSFLLVSLGAAAIGFSSWRRGGHSLNSIDDSIRGPMGD